MLILLALLRDRLPFRYEIWRAVHALAALGLIAFMLWHVVGDGQGGAPMATRWGLLTVGATAPDLWVYARWPGSAALGPRSRR